uniref:Retrotrans_gag domain-containing protein n=1 Tax=Caenorhabditis japonica TaxID=281687 RepID=A0A8R1J1M8_CAEJA
MEETIQSPDDNGVGMASLLALASLPPNPALPASETNQPNKPPKNTASLLVLTAPFANSANQNQNDNSPTSPDFIQLNTDQCLSDVHTVTRLCGAHLITLRESVILDLQDIHIKMNEITTATADRFDVLETRMQTFEGKTGVYSGIPIPFHNFGPLRQDSTAEQPLNQNQSESQNQNSNETPRASNSGSSGHSFVNSPINNQPPNAVPQVPSTPQADTPLPGRVMKNPNATPVAPPTATRAKTRPSESFYVGVLGLKMSASIPIFSGAPHENFSSFVRSFSDHANATRTPLSAEDKRAVFLTYLSDFARDKAEELIETNPNATFEEVRDFLKLTFQDPTRAEMERQHLRQCQQRAEESVDAFSARVRKLAQSAYMDKSREFIQDKAKEAFVDGLLFNLKFHVKGEGPKSFQDALNSAIKFELLLSEAAKSNTIVPQGLSIVPADIRPLLAIRNRHTPQPEVMRVTSAADKVILQGSQLRDGLHASQVQVKALIQRNSELSSSTTCPETNRRSVLSYTAVPGRLITVLTLATLFTHAAAFSPQICMPHSPETYSAFFSEAR